METDAVLVQYEKMCRQIASSLYRRTSYWHEYEDLLQEARIALVDANEKYDPSRTSFPKYAFYHIWQRVLDKIRSSGPEKRRSSINPGLRFEYPDSIDRYLAGIETTDGGRADAGWLADRKAQEAFDESLDHVADIQVIEGFLNFWRERKQDTRSTTATIVLEAVASGQFSSFQAIADSLGIHGSRVTQIMREVSKLAAEFRELQDV
jgi:RNA polymerase sigma factor (sigma-70 family)